MSQPGIFVVGRARYRLHS